MEGRRAAEANHIQNLVTQGGGRDIGLSSSCYFSSLLTYVNPGIWDKLDYFDLHN